MENVTERKLDPSALPEQIVNVYQAVPALMKQLKRRASGKEKALTSPYDELNSLIPGFYGGDLIVVAGRPSMGKTALAVGMALHAAVSAPVLFFSLEMSAQQIIGRLLSSLTGLSPSQIQGGSLSNQDYSLIGETWEDYKAALSNIYIVDMSYLLADTLVSIATIFKAQYTSLGAIFVDYIQLMSGAGGSEHRERDVAACSQAAKRVARSLTVPVFMLSQLNRGVELRANKRPLLSDLRESGAIEQDADAVIMVYRPEYYGGKDVVAGETELIVAKHRNGPTGTARIFFDKERATFESTSR